MSREVWRAALASVIGTSHDRLGLPCQDASRCEVLIAPEGEPVLVAVVSDGAGSAQRAEVGAALACDLALEEIRALLGSGGTAGDITRPFVESWLHRLHQEVAARADTEGLLPRDFACTVLAAVIGTERAAFFQVGDGGMVVSAPGEADDYGWVFWPETGEYENLTFFATEPHAFERLQHDVIERPIDEVALFTDGLQRLVLHYETRTAHAPFFRSMLSAVRQADRASLPLLSENLKLYLASPPINDRTDDDKTLVLATRRSGLSNS